MNQSHCLTMTPLRTLATPRLLTSSSKAHGSFTSSLQLLSLHHCGCHRCVVVLLRCCCVVAVLLCCCSVVVLLQCCCVVAVLLCLCMALDVVDVIPGLPWALPLPTLFILAIHLVDGLGPHTCPHCCVIVVALLLCCVVSCHCRIITVSCHIVAVSLLSSLHRCHCCIVVVVALLQLLCGEHRAAGPRAGTGRSYSITWDAAAIVGERR